MCWAPCSCGPGRGGESPGAVRSAWLRGDASSGADQPPHPSLSLGVSLSLVLSGGSPGHFSFYL